LLPSSVPDFGCETFVTIPEEGFSIIFIGSAYSVLPRIAWGLSWSYRKGVADALFQSRIYDKIGGSPALDHNWVTVKKV
jgi:hypothetical protein